MYSPTIMEAFAGFKALFDPGNTLNPGMIVAPEPITEQLALADIPPLPWQTTFTLHESAAPGSSPFAEAVQRCIGVGRCRGCFRPPPTPTSAWAASCSAVMARNCWSCPTRLSLMCRS